MEMTRKEFIVLTFALVGVGATAAGCSSENGNGGGAGSNGNAGSNGAVTCDDPLPASQQSDSTGHTHSVSVPESALDGSSAQTFTTSSAGGHTHMITLSANSLATIRAGGSVTVTSTTNGNHTHNYAVRCT